MNNGTNTSYEGRLTSEVRFQLTDLVKAMVVTNLGTSPSLKRLYGIAVELLDNARRYSSDESIRFSWRLEGDHVVIAIENKASKADAERLKRSVDAVNTMSRRELVQEFRRQLSMAGFGEKGGAGLGFLDIARKCKPTGDGPMAETIQARIRPAQDNDYICESQVSTKLT